MKENETGEKTYSLLDSIVMVFNQDDFASQRAFDNVW